MILLFWNLKKNKNEKWVVRTIVENGVDIALFAEYQKTSFDSVLSNLEEYCRFDGYGGCSTITLLCRKNIKVIVRREQSRYTLYTCLVENVTYNIAGVHLPANPYANSDDRKAVIRELVQDISEQEKDDKNWRTIVIGDFNCNPFDKEVIQKDSFNAVLFKGIINSQEVIKYNNKDRRRFYNPIINYISEDTNTYGSIYYASGIAPLYWNCFDQVLVRKELIDNVTSLEYLRKINGKKLIKSLKPNDSISDHLPLLVDISKGN